MQTDQTLRLLIAEESLNDAERLISVLRNVGHPVRPTRVEDSDALQASLHSHPQDLLLCAPGLQELPLDLALRTIQQSGHDVAIIALTDNEAPELRREVMAQGVADAVAKTDSEHFRYVVEREHQALQARRSQRRLEAALRESERRCESLLESSRDAIAYVHDGMHIYANHAYVERFGFNDREDVEGMPLLDLIAPAEQSRFRDLFRDYGRGDSPSTELHTRIRTDSDEEQEVRITLAEGSWDGEQATQILIREHEEQGLAKRLEYLAQQDMLTGLLNRNHFLSHLGHLLTGGQTSERGYQHALIYLRLDRADTIHENLGIGAVDQVMADTAEVLETNLPEKAIPARYTDTAFIALLPGSGVQDAQAAAEAVRAAVEAAPSDTGGQTVNKSVSAGVAMIGDNVATAEQAVNLGAEAADQATSAGGNRVHLHQGSGAEEDANGTRLQERLQNALDAGLVECLFQPIVALQGDTQPRYEVQAFLNDEHGELDNDALHGRARQVSLAAVLDRYILDAGLARASGEREPPMLFATISAESFADDALEGMISELVAKHGLAADRLTLQIPESVAITQLGQATRLAERLAEHGVHLCLTGFGNGLDSFRVLSSVPARYVRLDQALLRDVYSGGEAEDHVRKLVSAAHNAERAIIADGLSEALQIARLWQLGVDLLQGNFLRAAAPRMDYDFSGMVI